MTTKTGKVTAPKGMSKAEFAIWLKTQMGDIDPNALKSLTTDQYNQYANGKPVTVDFGGGKGIDWGTFAPRIGPGARKSIGEQLTSPSSSSSATNQPVKPAPPPTATSTDGATPGADATSILGDAAKTNPGLAAAMASGQISASTANLFPSLGLDPTAQVYGMTGKPERALGPQGGDVMRMTPVEYDTKPASYWLNGLYKMNPEDLLALQQQMFDQGWYKNTKITDKAQLNGRPDPNTLQAYADALGETARYNAAGKEITVDSVISMGAPAGPGSNAQGSPYELTNPADTKAALKSQAQQELGRDPSLTEQSSFASQYMANEDAARRHLAQLNAANTTQGVVGPASPTAAADDYINTHDVADRIAYGAAVRQQAFMSMLKSPV